MGSIDLAEEGLGPLVLGDLLLDGNSGAYGDEARESGAGGGGLSRAVAAETDEGGRLEGLTNEKKRGGGGDGGGSGSGVGHCGGDWETIWGLGREVKADGG